MRAAVDDVHHRHRQDVGLGAADITVERQAGGVGRGLGHRQRNAENGIGAEAADGTAARPIEPSSSTTSTSTVGFPRLSRISRPTMSMMAVIAMSPIDLTKGRARLSQSDAKGNPAMAE